MNKVLEIIATILRSTAIMGAGTASMWSAYQPDEPTELR